MGGSLEVVFRHRPLRQFDCAGMLATVQQLFQSHGVAVQLELGSVAPLNAPQMETVAVNGCKIAIYKHAELFTLVKLISPKQVVVFIVDRIEGESPFAACAAYPAGCPGLVITEHVAGGGPRASVANGRWVLSHELAHVLGLDHVTSLASLMNDSATSITAATPAITSTERSIIERSPWLGRPGTTVDRQTPRSSIAARETATLMPRRPRFVGSQNF